MGDEARLSEKRLVRHGMFVRRKRKSGKRCVTLFQGYSKAHAELFLRVIISGPHVTARTYVSLNYAFEFFPVGPKRRSSAFIFVRI